MPEKLILPPDALFVLGRLRDAGYSAYAVGGCVRDSLMGRVPGDYDVTTNARPEEMEEVFRGCRVVETGLKHGTITVVLDEMSIEITTYRIDGSYGDGRHPDSVTFADRLADDLCRRDFTVNAMAYSPETGVVDLFDGRGDIERKIIRCVGSAGQRFSEDGLRILRALRFSAVLGFEPDAACAEAVRRSAGLLDKISRERIRAELFKLLMGQNAGSILRGYAPVVAHTLPPLDAASVRRAGQILEEAAPADPLSVRTAVLLDALSPEDAARVMDSLKPSRDEKRAVMNLLTRRDHAAWDRYGIACLMRDVSDGFAAELARFDALTGRLGEDEAAKIAADAAEIARRGDCRRISDLAIDGRRLMSLGFRGASLGQTLADLLDAVMRKTCENTPEALEALALKRREPDAR